MGVEFDLAWAVDDEVLVLVRAELLFQPVEVVEQIPGQATRASASAGPACFCSFRPRPQNYGRTEDVLTQSSR